MTITEQNIIDLAQEAAAHGDHAMEDTCEQALEGAEWAWLECAEAIAGARAAEVGS